MLSPRCARGAFRLRIGICRHRFTDMERVTQLGVVGGVIMLWAIFEAIA